MDIQDILSNEGKIRIIQELVPGKQITIAHLIANPDAELYEKLGLNPNIDYSKSAIGIITISPAETAVMSSRDGGDCSGSRSEVGRSRVGICRPLQRNIDCNRYCF